MTARSGRTRGFLVVAGIAVAGTAAGHIGATSAITYAAGGRGGTATAVFLTIFMIGAGLATGWTHRVANRWGALTVFLWAQAGVAVSWALFGIIELVGGSTVVPLFIGAPIFGVFSGMCGVLTPFICRAYVDPASMSRSTARRGVATGIGALVGSAAAGYLIAVTDPGLGVLANGILTVPLLLFVAVAPPVGVRTGGRSGRASLRDALAQLRMPSDLRVLAIFAAGFSVLISPVVSMIVPILDDMAHTPLPRGAGLVLAGIAGGRLLVPRVVRRISDPAQEFHAAVRASIWAAAFVIAFGLAADVPGIDAEIVLWTLAGVGIGVARFTVRPLLIGVASRVAPKGDEVMGVALLVLVVTFTSPIGYLAWGLLMDATSATTAMIVYGGLTVVLAGLLSRRLQSE